ncbi:hypothetical protein GSI_12297 [Ganoderma sinense ZZ0214-1]|uniref:BTB domain-containing protein n=1 Tax=Ganoderma sinense ZZ0214-1 TaxID=1077348 RepID=A0A2G8RYD9_9APHY|nr:hypothetical protein GSI_12297 [Ganoderma sinense ZZ0214-1]
MTHDSRSTKRRRTSDSPERLIILAPGESLEPCEGQETFTRHADFWLDDGNLILLAGATAFRVLRSVLVKKSAVFADMFAAGSLDATETFEDCPVVRLPDHPDDLCDFLQYLIPCAPIILRGDGTPLVNFDVLHAAIHLAHKYQCPDVETQALFVLKKYYTCHFPEHDTYDASVTTLTVPPLSAAVAAINIARLTQSPSMLPFALYQACNLADVVMNGYKRRDGSVEHLAADDLRLCIRARTELAWELARVVDAVFSPTPTKHCRTFGECATAREMIHEMRQSHARGDCDALSVRRTSIPWWVAEFGLCKVCKREMLRRDVEERRRVWMLLPNMFGLDDNECSFTDGRDGESDSDDD